MDLIKVIFACIGVILAITFAISIIPVLISVMFIFTMLTLGLVVIIVVGIIAYDHIEYKTRIK